MFMNEEKTANGNIISYTDGPLTKPRYINPKIEEELVDFKKEIQEKFTKSKLRAFKMPLKKNSEPVPRGNGVTQHKIAGRYLAQSTDTEAMKMYINMVHQNLNP